MDKLGGNQCFKSLADPFTYIFFSFLIYLVKLIANREPSFSVKRKLLKMTTSVASARSLLTF
jgi:hypothetical protein